MLTVGPYVLINAMLLAFLLLFAVVLICVTLYPIFMEKIYIFYFINYIKYIVANVLRIVIILLYNIYIVIYIHRPINKH